MLEVQIKDSLEQLGKLWEEMSEEEHRLYPNDVEAMVGQGVIAEHSEEHLVTSDKGIVMLRRLLQGRADSCRNRTSVASRG